MRDDERTFDPDVWAAAEDAAGPRPRADKYYPDGSPIEDDELLPALWKWAALLEDTEARIVGNTRTLYGERLSTVWLGLDHNFSQVGPPIIYETILFAPDPKQVRRRSIGALAASIGLRSGEPNAELLAECDAFKAHIDKYYPHDQLQLRYSTRAEAEEMHETLKLQCLIPPRWRHFLLGTVAGITTWKFYDDKDDEAE